MVELVTIILAAVALLIILAVGYLIGKLKTEHDLEGKISEIREEAIKRSRAVLGGQFSEQLAPYLPDFPFSPTEARFIGKPIDLIVFKGMDAKNIEEVIFVEVKSGSAKLSPHERKLKDAVEAGKVRWVEYRIPREITEKQ